MPADRTPSLPTAGRVLCLVLGLLFAASAAYVASVASDGAMWLGAALVAALSVDLLVAALQARHPRVAGWLSLLP